MSKQNLPVWVASIVALLGAVAAILHYLPPNMSQWLGALNGREIAFTQSLQKLNNDLQAQKPSMPALRSDAETAYDQASQVWFGQATGSKCRVVRVFSNLQNPDIADAAPMDAYSDYQASRLSPCSGDVFTVATLDWDSFLSFTALGDGSVERLAAIRHVVAQGTSPRNAGWVYLGELDANGRYSIRYFEEANANAGDTVTTASGSTDDGLMLHYFPPAQSGCVTQPGIGGGVAGFLPDGSRITILKVAPLPGCVQQSCPRSAVGPWSCRTSTPVKFVFAEARVVSVQPLLASAFGREFIHLQRTRREATLVAMGGSSACPSYTQHNSLHGRNQLWVLAGETDNANRNAFLPGTSRVNTNCIPRDGQLVRATQSLRIFIGADPHYPGVSPQGGIVAAGTEIRVVGDVAGYPFDATANPGFCNQVPVPQKNLTPIPAGHRKHYCVYLPFTPA
jgi:hypothetical protein